MGEGCPWASDDQDDRATLGLGQPHGEGLRHAARGAAAGRAERAPAPASAEAARCSRRARALASEPGMGSGRRGQAHFTELRQNLRKLGGGAQGGGPAQATSGYFNCLGGPVGMAVRADSPTRDQALLYLSSARREKRRAVPWPSGAIAYSADELRSKAHCSPYAEPGDLSVGSVRRRFAAEAVRKTPAGRASRAALPPVPWFIWSLGARPLGLLLPAPQGERGLAARRLPTLSLNAHIEPQGV